MCSSSELVPMGSPPTTVVLRDKKLNFPPPILAEEQLRKLGDEVVVNVRLGFKAEFARMSGYLPR